MFPHTKGTRYETRSQAAVGFNDVVQDDEIHDGVSAPSVLVRSESDLSNLSGYPAGTFAYTAGFKAMWQLDASGNWVSMI